MKKDNLIELLRRIGYPVPSGPSWKMLHEIVSDFQRVWTFNNLVVDGYAGPKTERALRECLDRGGRISAHFRVAEFESKGNQDYTIKIRRGLVLGLEELRRRLDRPIGILSGYRDPDHNARVGGASNSQHLYGNAIDPSESLPLDVVRACERFSGIGIDGDNGRVRHVDVRHLGPNTTGGTPERPTIWRYS